MGARDRSAADDVTCSGVRFVDRRSGSVLRRAAKPLSSLPPGWRVHPERTSSARKEWCTPAEPSDSPPMALADPALAPTSVPKRRCRQAGQAASPPKWRRGAGPSAPSRSKVWRPRASGLLRLRGSGVVRSCLVPRRRSSLGAGGPAGSAPPSSWPARVVTIEPLLHQPSDKLPQRHVRIDVPHYSILQDIADVCGCEQLFIPKGVYHIDPSNHMLQTAGSRVRLWDVQREATWQRN